MKWGHDSCPINCVGNMHVAVCCMVRSSESWCLIFAECCAAVGVITKPDNHHALGS